MAHINVKSFDFDGCIFNITFLTSKDKCTKFLIATNQALINTESKTIREEKFDETIFMVDSNRQSCTWDHALAEQRKTGSCF